MVFRPVATALLLLLNVAACAGTGRTPAPSSPQPASRYPVTEADVNFMTAMIGHHQQALIMAGWAPTHGASPSIKRLAERITGGQQDEIATMQQWLGDHGRPSTQAHQSGHGHAMPGMLTGAQMRQLELAKGPEFDRLFLTFMIQHHRGAVTMVKQLFATPGAAQNETVFKFANDVSVDQTTEIARMERMLAALPGAEPAS
jgi:uncharacterized protein (DUF305 family)